ncbi:MAG: sporulation protein YtfJ [Clostridia bacterium]|nr:sporulation protein YtfJ [Clostridia bacterium]
MAENKLNDMIGVSLEKIKELAGTETVIGNPIYTPNGTLILPVSKVSMGFASGGIDYGQKKNDEGTESKKPDRFGGGGGTGVTVTPIAFLIVAPDGKVELTTINTSKNTDTVDKVADLIERSPDIIERLKDVFVGAKKKTEGPVVEKAENDG